MPVPLAPGASTMCRNLAISEGDGDEAAEKPSVWLPALNKNGRAFGIGTWEERTQEGRRKQVQKDKVSRPAKAEQHGPWPLLVVYTEIL
jgi:hypothetical protein